jgi:hypothetical protein
VLSAWPLAHHRRFVNGLRGLSFIVVRLFRLLPLPAAALSVDDLGGEEGVGGNGIMVDGFPTPMRWLSGEKTKDLINVRSRLAIRTFKHKRNAMGQRTGSLYRRMPV